MSDSLAKQLISAVSASWNERAPSLLGCSSTLSQLTSREVSGDGLAPALALAMTWPAAFAMTCSGTGNGVLIFLCKSEEGEDFDRLARQPSDGLPRPGGRALINSALEGTAATLAANPSTTLSFSPAVYIDLTTDETRLAAIVKESACIATFSLTVGDESNSQALIIYAPNGSLEKSAGVKDVSNSAPAPITTATSASEKQQMTNSSDSNSQQTEISGQPNETRRNGSPRRDDVAPRNIERLLDVELEVVVRFGITSLPLRDVVRMGVGTMIELNRAVDEPVELLVNGRQLARGEVVVVDGYYGVRITEIGPASERAASIA